MNRFVSTVAAGLIGLLIIGCGGGSESSSSKKGNKKKSADEVYLEKFDAMSPEEKKAAIYESLKNGMRVTGVQPSAQLAAMERYPAPLISYLDEVERELVVTNETNKLLKGPEADQAWEKYRKRAWDGDRAWKVAFQIPHPPRELEPLIRQYWKEPRYLDPAFDCLARMERTKFEKIELFTSNLRAQQGVRKKAVAYLKGMGADGADALNALYAVLSSPPADFSYEEKEALKSTISSIEEARVAAYAPPSEATPQAAP